MFLFFFDSSCFVVSYTWHPFDQVIPCVFSFFAFHNSRFHERLLKSWSADLGFLRPLCIPIQQARRATLFLKARLGT